MLSPRLALCLAVALLAVACTALPSSPAAPVPTVDVADPVPGVPDRGDDPAVVAVDSGGPLCAGVLLAADVVLTALHCAVAGGVPPVCADAGSGGAALASPSSIRVLVGDDMASAVERARARAIVAPSPSDPCAADIALLLLDQVIDDIQPVSVQATGAADGDHVRTVGFQPAGASGVATRSLRDHVEVIATSPTTLAVAEAACSAGCGGPALSEATGDVVGVASRWSGAGGSAAFDEYVRADAFLGLVGEALAQSTAGAEAAGSASRQKALKGPADMGANCVAGAGCAAGACVTDGPQRYCTRSCDPHDACPAHFRCEATAEGITVCIET